MLGVGLGWAEHFHDVALGRPPGGLSSSSASSTRRPVWTA